jgi:hypothetical protein
MLFYSIKTMRFGIKYGRIFYLTAHVLRLAYKLKDVSFSNRKLAVDEYFCYLSVLALKSQPIDFRCFQ